MNTSSNKVFIFVFLCLVCLEIAQSPAQSSGTANVLKEFGRADLSGRGPSELIQGADGLLYGTTWVAGGYGRGTVFKLNLDGTGYRVIHSFGGVAEDGEIPAAGLVQDRNGALYGTTTVGGGDNVGTVYKVNPDGTGYEVLHRFSATGWDGQRPSCALIQGPDGTLYGTTSFGGQYGNGTVFKINPDGTGYAILRSCLPLLPTGVGDGWIPNGLVLAANGALYGTTVGGGETGDGVIFKLNQDGSGYVVLHSFNGGSGNYGDGAAPFASLVQDENGVLYGTTRGDPYAYYQYDTIYKVNSDGTGFTVLHRFAGTPTDGAGPLTRLLLASNGILYGTTDGGGASGWGTVFKINRDGTGYSIVQNCENPNALIQCTDGNLYGTTGRGGTADSGIVFKLSLDGTAYMSLFSFTPTGGDEVRPEAELLQGGDGGLYGTTSMGGSNGYGAVFKISTNGSGYSALHYFTEEARFPRAALMQGADGALYGTTTGDWYGATVFSLGVDGGGYRVIHTFDPVIQEGAPRASLVQDSEGVIYGTTYSGGANGAGTVFRLTPGGSDYSVLHSFGGTSGDGQEPGGLLLSTNGVLFGITETGGNGTTGTIFRLNRDGTDYAVLHCFGLNAGDGATPCHKLAWGVDGALYGTTQNGGFGEGGTVFKINTDGTGYSILHEFTNNPVNTRQPLYGLVRGQYGVLYGITAWGGQGGVGTLFKLDPDGAGYAEIYSFRTPRDVHGAFVGLTAHRDGNLYVTCGGGGDMGYGSLLRISSLPTIAPPRFGPLTLLPDGSRLLSLFGVGNAVYRIEGSIDLTAWVGLTNLSSPSGTMQFIDSSASPPLRFYRAVGLP